MHRFFKSQLASFLSSSADYCFTAIAVELFGFWYVLGTALGTITGGFVNFSLGRTWVFNSKERAAPVQLLRYFMVWLGYLILSTSGIYLLTHYLHINYLITKLTITLMLALSYNYPLQKAFVFK